MSDRAATIVAGLVLLATLGALVAIQLTHPEKVPMRRSENELREMIREQVKKECLR